MWFGHTTHLDILPTFAQRTPPATLKNQIKDFAGRAAWSVLRPSPKPQLAKLNAFDGEFYDLRGLISRADRRGISPGHFLNFPDYQGRDFLVCEGRDIAMTRNAKAIAAPEFGFIEEFNVGGAGGLPRDLLARDLRERDGGWRAKETDIEWLTGFSIPLCHFGFRTFGHFILDALLQIYIFREPLNSGDARLVHWRILDPWMTSLLHDCGVGTFARRQLSKPVALMQRAGLSSALAGHGVYFPSSLSLAFFDWMRSTFSAPRSFGARRLYIRRQNAYGRAIYNEEALADLVRRYGFEAISPEHISVPAQMRLFAEAGVVLSPWGSGLTLAPLLSGPRSVIELLPSAVTDPWFSRQAVVHKLDYRPIVQPSDAMGNMTVDLVAVEKALSSLT